MLAAFTNLPRPVNIGFPEVIARTTSVSVSPFDQPTYELPPELEASEPPEARGLQRDEVRLMVSNSANNHITHTCFRDLRRFLEPDDLLVLNTSGTMNAALPATRPDGTSLELHLSTHLPADLWTVELRRLEAGRTKTFYKLTSGETLQLPAGATATLHRPYLHETTLPVASRRLWLATLHLPCPLNEYLTQHGFPIRYGYVKEQWSPSYYQTVYATEVGSAEMPSAGRAFTAELLTGLIAYGVRIAPLILHTGVASLESHEPPYEEFYRVPLETARQVNETHARGKRVIAVGTTVVRALETVTDEAGVTHPGEGWTCLVITPQRRVRAINALLTGLHEPQASHLAMLEAFAGREHLQLAYAEALREQYLWHEFGDLHLIV